MNVIYSHEMFIFNYSIRKYIMAKQLNKILKLKSYDLCSYYFIVFLDFT